MVKVLVYSDQTADMPELCSACTAAQELQLPNLVLSKQAVEPLSYFLLP